MAKLLEAPQRGYVKITDRGLKILAGQPGSISVSFLKQFPEFNEFIAPNDLKNGQTTQAGIITCADSFTFNDCLGILGCDNCDWNKIFEIS